MTDTRNSLPKPGARHSAQGRPSCAALLLPLLPGLAVLTVAAILFFTAGPSIAKAVLGILCFIAGMPFLGLGFLVAGQRLPPPRRRVCRAAGAVCAIVPTALLLILSR